MKLAVRSETKQRNEQMLLMQKQQAEAARSQSEHRHYQTHDPTQHLPVDYTKRRRTDTNKIKMVNLRDANDFH